MAITRRYDTPEGRAFWGKIDRVCGVSEPKHDHEVKAVDSAKTNQPISEPEEVKDKQQC